MRVLCTGPESSGTRLLTRLVENLGIEAIHKSIPHGMEWWSHTENVDRIICVVRDPFVTIISATEAGHPGHWIGLEATFPYRITHAWEVMVKHISEYDVPWIPITYEGLIQRPQWTVDNIADWLGVTRQPLEEEVSDPRKVLTEEPLDGILDVRG